MSKIATEQEAKNIGKSSSSITSNKCCTYARAIALGCKLPTTYATNRLVQTAELSIASSISVSPAWVSEYNNNNISSFEITVVSTSSWSSLLNLYTKPVKGYINWSPKLGSAGTTYVIVDADGTMIDNGPTADIEEWYCGGDIIFTNYEGMTAEFNVDISYTEEIV